MDLVKFTDKNHIYTCNSIKYTSASGLFKNFQQPFDSPNKTLMKAYGELVAPEAVKSIRKKTRDYPHLFVKEIQKYVSDDLTEKAKEIASEYAKQWSKAGLEGSSFGTERHSEKEKIDIDRGWSMNPYTGEKFQIPDHYYKMREKHSDVDNISMAEDLKSLPDGYYPEFLIHWHPWQTAGQADKAYIETVDGVKYLDLDDWKTDKKIKHKGFFHTYRGMQKLLYPLDHIPDANRFIYEIKISFYAYMCEQHGLVPRHLGFTHLKYNKDRTEEIGQKLYRLMYRKWECEMMVKHFLKAKKQGSSS